MAPRTIALAVGSVAVAAFAVWLALRIRAADSGPTITPAPVDAAPVLAPIASGAQPVPQRSPKRPIPPPDPMDPAVARDLADPDPKVRLVRVNQLIEEGDDPAALLAASRDRDEAVSVLAMEGLGKLYAAGRIALAELTSRHEDRNLSSKARTAALEAIGQVASDDGGRYLAELGQRGDAEQRRAAATLLGRQPRAIAVPALRALAQDGDPAIRQRANASLRTLGAE